MRVKGDVFALVCVELLWKNVGPYLRQESLVKTEQSSLGKVLRNIEEALRTFQLCCLRLFLFEILLADARQLFFLVGNCDCAMEKIDVEVGCHHVGLHIDSQVVLLLADGHRWYVAGPVASNYSQDCWFGQPFFSDFYVGGTLGAVELGLEGFCEDGHHDF